MPTIANSDRRTNQRLSDLLIHPQEDLDREYKGWLDLSNKDDRANVAQALLALANHGGGFLIFGFTPRPLAPDANRPADLSGYSADGINGIVAKFADPSFHCSVDLVKDENTLLEFPVVVVPGGHHVPIRSKAGAERHIQQYRYYIRRPGPCSEMPQTGKEWDELIRRCLFNAKEGLLDGIRGLLLGGQALHVDGQQPDSLQSWIDDCNARWSAVVEERLKGETPSRFRFGYWTCAYEITGDFEPPARSELLNILSRVKGRESGWPPWWIPINNDQIMPYTFENDLFECWLGYGPNDADKIRDAAHSDFWSASTKGKMYLRRGYFIDQDRRFTAGTSFSVSEPIWQLGQCLLHAARLTKFLTKGNSEFRFLMVFTGLAGRKLVRTDEWYDTPTHNSFICRQTEFVTALTLTPQMVSDNLNEVLLQPIRMLYERFNYFDSEMGLAQLIAAEVGKMDQSRMNGPNSRGA